MLQRPRFRPHVQPQTVEGEGVFLLSETETRLLRGRLPQLLAPLLDGRRSRDEIVDELADRASAAEVYYALLQLERQGHLVEGDVAPERGEAAWWSIQGADPTTARTRLAEGRVAVRQIGDVRAEPVRRALASLGVAIGEPSALLVVVTDDHLRDGLREVNEDALRRGEPWLLVRPVGASVWLGPLFRPGATACWECLAQRLRANRAVELHLHARNGHAHMAPLPSGWSAATLGVGLSLAAGEAARWLAAETSACAGTIITLDVRSGATRTHAVVRRPQCAACGEPGSGSRSVAVALGRGPKAITSGGGHRVVDPEVTLSRFEHHVSPLSGAVTALEKLPSVAGGVLHIYSASHGVTTPQRSLNGLRNTLRRTCCGKGMTDAQARISGLCEALERYSAGFAGDEPRRRATFDELGDDAVDPRSCTLFSDRQHRERGRWNAQRGYFCRVPARFDPEAPIDWSPIWSMTRQAVRLLPTGLCYLDYQPEDGEEQFVHTSNGLAAGNTLEEAILHGCLEVVERDSCALWWYGRVRRPGVDWQSFDDEHVSSVAAYLRERGRVLQVLDVTSDLGVPTFVALSRRVDCGPERIVMGFGAHLDASVALTRAVTEMTHMLAWLLAPDGEERIPEADLAPIAADWLRGKTLARQPYLAPDPDAPERRACDFPRLWSDDLRDDVAHCQSVLEQRGLELLVLDLTRRDVGLPAVKVVVPGLRPLWPRLAPGRLYDVPVQQGWLPEALTEAQLNPIPMFL